MVAFVKRLVQSIYLLSAWIEFRLESVTFSSMLSIQREKYKEGER